MYGGGGNRGYVNLCLYYCHGLYMMGDTVNNM